MPRLPTTDLTSDAIKAFLGITGEVTLDDICKSDRVRGEYFDINYLHGMAQAYYGLLSALAGFPLAPAGIREGVRLAPQDISNFRNYGYDVTGYSIIAFSGEHNDNKILKYNNDEYWNDFYSAPIRDMRTAVRASDGVLWVGGQVSIFIYANERGLFSFNGSTWRRYTAPEITGQYVYAIELGTDPYMWVGTEHGFSIFDRTAYTFTHYYIGAGTVPTGKLPSNVINCFAYNSDDESMWVGTANGLIHIIDIADPAAWHLLKTTDGLPGNNVKCLMVGPDGDCWAGFDGQGMSRITESGGVYTFDNINTGSVPGLVTNHILKIAIDPDTYEVWAATNNGIQYFHWNLACNDVTILSTTEGLPSNYVYTVRRDSDNRKWFGFDDHIGMIVDISDEIRVWGQWNGGDSLNIHEFLVDYEPQQVINEVVIGNQTWMSNNWRGNKRFMFSSGEKSKVYNYDEYNRELYGGLFTWNQVNDPDFCPTGWHIPSYAEWWELITYLGGTTAAGDALKARSFGWISHLPTVTNSTGFNVVGSGYFHTIFLLDYFYINEITQFWTSDENDLNPTHGITIGFYYDRQDAYVEAYDKSTYWFPIRLIKDGPSIPAPVAVEETNYGHNRFDANWLVEPIATGYYLDVATDSGFTTFVAGFEDLDVGNVLTYDVTGLDDDTTYYYRVRSYDATLTSVSSNTITAVTPKSMLITSRGDGLGVSVIILTATAGLTLTLNGTAKFYSNALGTLNESSTWVNANGTRYVRCPSGTAEIFFSHIEKLTKAGDVNTTNSGSSFWGYDSGNYAGSSSLDTRTWNYPNCTIIGFMYSAPVLYFNADITDLSPTLEKFLSIASGTFTGTWANIPDTCTIFSISMINTMSGDISDISSNMKKFYVVSGNTSKTGDIADLPAGLLEFTIVSANTISGDVANLPTSMTRLSVYGSNTITGDIADLPLTLNYITLAGLNTLYGDIVDFPATLVTIYIYGSNIISGDLINIPPLVAIFNIAGLNTITGGFTTIPSSCKDLRVLGSNTVNGDLADLPDGMNYLSIYGLNTISGDLSDLDNTFYIVNIVGSNTVTGDLVDLPTNLQDFRIAGLNTITGDLANIPVNCYYFNAEGLNTISDYTHKTWSLNSYIIYTIPNSGGMSSAEVDQILIDLDTDCLFSTTGTKAVNISGTHAAPTATSAAARASLIVKGVALTVNP